MASQTRVVSGSLPALEAALASEIRAAKARDPLDPPVILTGEVLLRPYLRRLLAREAGGHINLRITTPSQLARQLVAPGALDHGRRPLPRGGDRVLAEEVALASRGYFDPVRQAPGFAQALRRLFRELRQAGIRPDDFARAVGDSQATGELAKLETLARLYGEHERRRAAFAGPDDAFAPADPARFEAPALLVYGLLDPPPIVLDLLARLMAAVPVTVFLPVTGTVADRAHERLRQWLARHGAASETAAAPDEPPTALAHLQRRLFAAAEAGPLDETVRLLSAPDPVREAREAARACLAWAREGIAFHEMAVTYRNRDPYRGLLDEVFREAGIPIYLHDGRSLAEHPLGRGFLALLALIESPLRRSEVMAFLTEAPLPPALAEAYGAIEPATWDALSREAGIVEGRAQWLQRLSFLRYGKLRDRRDEEGEPDERLQATLETIDRFSRFIGDLSARLDQHPGRATWSAHLAYLRELATSYIDGVAPLLDRLDALTGLAPIVGEVPFTRFQHVVRTWFQEMTTEQVLGEPNGRFGRQGVNVLDVNSLRHLRFRALAVLGLSERAFPPPPRQDALLLDWERGRLNGANGWEIPTRAPAAEAEPLQFVLAVQAARERLLLSYPRGEAASAKAHLPSHFLRAAAEALTGERVTTEAIDQLSDALYTRVPATRFGAATPPESLTPLEYHRTLLATARSLGMACLEQRAAGFAQARTAWTARWRNTALTAYDGVLDAAVRAQLARRSGLERSMSPTRLEGYATCPFRFFLKSILRLEPIIEPELVERIAALDKGNLVHEILDRFLRECGPADPPCAKRRTAHLERLRAIARAEFAEWEQRGLVGFPLLWELDQTELIEDLETWYGREMADGLAHGYRPSAFELRFGPRWQQVGRQEDPRSRDHPLAISVDGVTLRFQGRIDRIDRAASGDGFRVIDYKTGGKRSYYKDGCLSGGQALQLPVYILAAAEALGVDWRASQAQYFYVSQKGEFDRVSFTGETLHDRWDEFTGLLYGLASGIADGDFHPVPGEDAANCTWCEFRAVCDARIHHLAERKAGDPRAAAFARLGEVT